MSPVSALSPVSAPSSVSAPSPVSAPSTASAPSPVSALTRSLYNSIPLIHDNVESYILSTTSHNPATHFSAVPTYLHLFNPATHFSAVLTYLHIFQSSHAFLRPLPISHSFSPDLLRGPPVPRLSPIPFLPHLLRGSPASLPISHSFSPNLLRGPPPPCIFHNSKPLLIYKFCLRYVIFKKNVFIGERITL